MTSQEYLQSLRAHLKSMPAETREEIVMEITSHIQESLALGQPLDQVLAHLGTPEHVAAAYRDNLIIRRARGSFSPLVIARAVARIATKGVFGFAIAVCATIGYCFGFGMVLIALMKPILPRHTGLWMEGSRVINAGVIFPAPQPPVHDILGQAIIPIALVLGTLIILITMISVRFFLRTSRFVQQQFQSSPDPIAHPATAH